MDPDDDPRLTSDRIRSSGVELHAMTGGPEDGPLVILLHGFPDAWWTWRGQLGPLIDAGYRVVVPTMRGYGLSDKPGGVASYTVAALADDVLAIADHAGRRTFRLAGHDWGGVVAWETAIRAPGRVERLVVLDAPHPDVWGRVALRHPSQILRSGYVALFQLPRLPEVLIGSRGFALGRRALAGSSAPGTFSDDDLDRHVADWRRPGAMTAMINYYRALRLKPRRSPALVVPRTLVVWGGEDRFLSRPLYEASLAMCADGTGLWVEDATHWVHLEQPARVAEEIVRFLDDTPPTPTEGST